MTVSFLFVFHTLPAATDRTHRTIVTHVLRPSSSSACAEESQSALTPIKERYMGALRSHLAATKSSQPIRLDYLLGLSRLVEGAAELLMKSKMFYVPFLLNSGACIAKLHSNCPSSIGTPVAHGSCDNEPLASVVESPELTGVQR